MNPTAYPDMPSRLQRQFHVTGTQYISTDKVQSQTLNTGGTAEDYFSPWAISPGRFFTIFITANYLPSQSSKYSQSASLLAQQNQRSAILPPVLVNTQLRNLFVLCAFAGVVYILVPGNLRCSEKSHCLSAASLRFF